MLGQQPPCGTGDCQILLDEEHMMELIKDLKPIDISKIDNDLEIIEEEDDDNCLENTEVFNFSFKEPNKCFNINEQVVKII
jgi:hypothetical protein